MNHKVILCDIEGTTTSLSFVHDVLFPISSEGMEAFIQQNWSTGLIRSELESISTGKTSPEEVTRVLRSWIAEDRKEPALKSIQGKIWKDAFESRKIQGHVYADVPPNFRKWQTSGIKICIFSSGSVEAQQLLFRYSEAGDLTPYIYEYFDTSVGPKKMPSSYEAIASRLSAKTAEILFLSDSEIELNAARTSGMSTSQVLRDGIVKNTSGHPTALTFDEIL